VRQVHPRDALQIFADARDKYAGEFEHMYYNIAEQSSDKTRSQPHLPLRPLTQSMVNDIVTDQSPGIPSSVSPQYSDYAIRVGDVYKRVCDSTFQTAEVFIVRPNMCQLIEHAVKDMPDQILLPSDPPSDAGVAFFDEGIRINPEAPPIYAVSWITTSVYVGANPDGNSATFGGDDRGKPETYRTIFFTIFYDRDNLLVQKLIAKGSGRSESYVRKMVVRWPRMLMLDVCMWKYGSLPNCTVPHPLFGKVEVRDALAGRMQAFFALCRQELPSIEQYEPTDKELKWIRRLDMRTNPVSVILLRRKSGRGLENTEVEWSHRWLVRGHWRNQWYSTLKEHRLIYINPHIKGPDDKPLIVHDKVNLLGR
jgi:hypothetical protein